MATINRFKFDKKPIRVTGTWENPIFPLPDVCKAVLGIKKPKDLTEKDLLEDEFTLDTIYGKRRYVTY